MSFVDVVYVISMLNGSMTAVSSVFVIVSAMFLTSHFLSPFLVIRTVFILSLAAPCALRQSVFNVNSKSRRVNFTPLHMELASFIQPMKTLTKSQF